jgi:hypothetical protein
MYIDYLNINQLFGASVQVIKKNLKNTKYKKQKAAF